MNKLKSKAILLVAGILLPAISIAQNWDLPDDRVNDRFFSTTEFQIKRPGLTLQGFQSGNQYGLDVKQILEMVFIQEDLDKIEVYQEIVNEAAKSITYNTANNNQNSATLQARAFMALMTFILEENQHVISQSQINSVIDNHPTHQQALDDLMEVLQAPNLDSEDLNLIRRYTESKYNPFRYGRPLMNIARTMDLYLALENAYEDLNGDESQLLDQTQKEHFIGYLNDMRYVIHDRSTWMWNSLAVHKVQAGNWPLIPLVAVGYASIAQGGTYAITNERPYFTYTSSVNDATGRVALNQISGADKRDQYWNYMTGGGERYWAESPHYFSLAIPAFVPFWHALRINGLLEYNDLDGSDPFMDERFNNSLEWMADIVTPDGMYPSINDGTKEEMKVSQILRWDDQYGLSDTGVKHQYIYDEKTNRTASVDNYLYEIAIPTAQTPSINPIPELLGNSDAEELEEQQSIVRFNALDGEQYYLLLNGEHGDNITSGEGHQQPDNLNLLWYGDEGSYLMNRGYDGGSKFYENDKYNSFRHNNSMRPAGEGLPSPNITVNPPSFDSEHFPVSSNFVKQDGAITRLRATQPIYSSPQGDPYIPVYQRQIYVIAKDTENNTEPYIIDVNRHTGDNDHAFYTQIYEKLHLRYHLDTESNSSNQVVDDIGTWNEFDFGSKTMYLYSTMLTNIISDMDVDYVDDLSSKEEEVKEVSRYQLQSGLPNTRDDNVMSILYLSSSGEPSVTKLIDGDDREHLQALAINHGGGVVDVAFQRAKPDGEGGSNTMYNQDVTVNIPAAEDKEVTLKAGETRGFVRLIEEINGVWTYEPDYLDGVTTDEVVVKNNYTFSSNATIGSVGSETYTGTTTLEHEVTVTVSDGSEVIMTDDILMEEQLITGGPIYGELRVDGELVIYDNTHIEGGKILVRTAGFTESYKMTLLK